VPEAIRRQELATFDIPKLPLFVRLYATNRVILCNQTKTTASSTSSRPIMPYNNTPIEPPKEYSGTVSLPRKYSCYTPHAIASSNTFLLVYERDINFVQFFAICPVLRIQVINV
jgi:hypothetical protein